MGVADGRSRFLHLLWSGVGCLEGEPTKPPYLHRDYSCPFLGIKKEGEDGR